MNRAFQPTSNGRNEAMFKEATDFAQCIRMLEKDIKHLLKSIDCGCRGVCVPGWRMTGNHAH